MAIDPQHPLIIEHITEMLAEGLDVSNIALKISDYDGTVYMITGIAETMIAFIMISEEIKSIGDAVGYEALEHYLQGFQADRSSPNQYSIIVDKSLLPIEKVQRDIAVKEIARKFSMIRTVFLSGPYFKALAIVKQDGTCPPQQVNIRKNEKLWIISGNARVTFVLQILYKDNNDSSLARIFLQEVQDSKKLIANAPVISFGAAPPENISQFRPKAEGLFLSITLLKDQINNPTEQAKWLCGFRQYLSYHIHTCKTYLHMRMRKRTEILLGVLRQAVPEKLEEKIFKKARAVKGIKEDQRIINNFKS